MRVRVDAMRRADWSRVSAIYREGIAGGNATFETEALDWEAFDRAHLATCRLAARAGREVVGWATLSAVSSRCVYAGVAEVSVYVADAAQGRGVGRRLLQRLARRESSPRTAPAWRCTRRSAFARLACARGSVGSAVAGAT
jgi:phosphinothricin acetyltransferase